MVAELILIFLRLGLTSFGGPAAHLSLMEEEFVHQRQWLSREKFLDLVAMANLIPGPNSTEVAIHIGYLRAGWWGFWIAGICFILPAFIIVTVIAYFYKQYASLPDVQHFLLGINAVVLTVIAQAFLRFLKSVFKIKSFREIPTQAFWNEKQNVLIIFIILTSLYLRTQNMSEIFILLNCAFIALFISQRFTGSRHHELASIFWVFFKIGSVLFGSGYVLLSFLQAEIIQNKHWITQTQLLDAISVGQFTPGPVFTTASFLGYLLQGIPGALAATAGIFLPAFLFVGLSIPLYKKINSSILFRSILSGVIAGSLGLLLFTLGSLTHTLTGSALLWIISLGSALLLWKKPQIPAAVLVLIGGLLSFSLVKI
ncbi:MAG: chromate efflux transporter [Pseudobdellovibrionaceae bacterium]